MRIITFLARVAGLEKKKKVVKIRSYAHKNTQKHLYMCVKFGGGGGCFAARLGLLQFYVLGCMRLIVND